jgi:ABC-2 type transport system ATP-binding protein
MTPAIDVDHIVKQFGTFTAVKGMTFSVAQGEIFGLLGPNGAGKSTLIRMLTTLLPPTSGAARVNGYDVVRQADDVRRSIGVIPQALTSDLELSVEENLIIFAKLYGVPSAKRKRLIDELLKAVELSEWRSAPVKNLSGGMRRRVEIARGLVHEPRIFFLDEPTTGLDPVSRSAVWEMLRSIKAARDLTVLLTTHYMDEADKLCDRIAIVDHGELKALDSPLRLKMSVPDKNTLEVSFNNTTPAWNERLKALPFVDTVSGDGAIVRIHTSNGPATTRALLDVASEAGVGVGALSVQSTTLDAVVQADALTVRRRRAGCTGRSARDESRCAAHPSGVLASAASHWVSIRASAARASASSVSCRSSPSSRRWPAARTDRHGGRPCARASKKAARSFSGKPRRTAFRTTAT